MNTICVYCALPRGSHALLSHVRLTLRPARRTQRHRPGRGRHVHTLGERDGGVVKKRNLKPGILSRHRAPFEPLHRRRQRHGGREQRERTADA